MLDGVTTLLETLNSLSPLAVIALLAVIIYLQMRGKQQVDTLKTNDLHHLEGHLEDMYHSLQRVEVLLSKEFAYIRARLNGSR
jgi:hypothetical protein